MPLDLFKPDQRNADVYMATRPGWGPGLDPSFGETFSEAWQTNNRMLRDIRMQMAEHRHVQDWIDSFQKATGVQLANPMNAAGSQLAPLQDELFARLAQAYQNQSRVTPNLALPPPPTADEAFQSAVASEQAMQRDAAALSARPQTFTSSAGSVLGGFAAVGTDPINLAAMAAMPIEGVGVLGYALRSAAAAAATQGAIEAAGLGTNRAINPGYGAADIAANVGGAALGGLLLGGGIKGLGALWSRLRAPQVLPRGVQDLGNVVERKASVQAASPYQSAGAEGEIAHAANYNEAEQAVTEGREPEIPLDQYGAGTWRPSRVYAADGRQVGVRYEVVEADSLAASQLADGSPNPSFPPELQPRDRTRAASAAQIADIAANLEPERLGPSPDASTGAPVVGPDSIVESGNGRVAAIRRAYANGLAEPYRDYLGTLGFDTGDMRAPVLVARRVTPLSGADRIAFTDAANRASALRLSAPEQALADARLLDGDTMGKLGEGGAASADNRPFVRAFLAKLPQSERGGLTDRGGALSAEGIRRVDAALLARAYGDPATLSRILEAADSNVKALGGALTDAAPGWAALRDAVTRSEVPAGMDITGDLLDAFRLVAKARDSGRKLADLVDQAEMFAAPSPASRALLKMMFRDDDLAKPASRRAVADGLRAYTEEARKNTTDDRLFGDPLGSDEVLNTALAKAGRSDLFAAAEQATTPEAAREELAKPEVDQAAIHQVEHMIEQEERGIRVFHGTPHDIARFDIGKIGTGEGAQAYGYGLYFAENPEVARFYKNTLGDRHRIGEESLDASARAIADATGERDIRVRKMPEQFEVGGRPTWNVYRLDEPARLFKKAKETLIGQIQKMPDGTFFPHPFEVAKVDNILKHGRLYEVNIPGSPGGYLDFDAPLREQSDTVKDALRRAGIDPEADETGGDLLKRMEGDSTPAAAAGSLREAGILGVRYLDAKSRGPGGDGTRNFVAFDDKGIDIVSREGPPERTLMMPVSSVDEHGVVSTEMRSVQAMLDEADAEIKAAREIEGCVTMNDAAE